MATYPYPTSAELQKIEQDKMPDLIKDRMIFDFMPMRNVDQALLMWEQLDNFKGLQQLRGLNGEPPRVQPIGLKQWQMQPGVYGEHMLINETDITLRRRPGTRSEEH